MLLTSNQWILFGLDISLKVMLLALVVATSLRLIGARDANVRHRVWTGLLAGMIALPILALVLPSIPMPLPVAMSVDSPDSASASPPDASNPELGTPGLDDPSRPSVAAEEIDSSEAGVRAAIPAKTTSNTSSSSTVPANDTRAETTASVPSGDSAEQTGSLLPTITHSGLLVSVWLFGSTFLVLRLCLGLGTTARVLSRARELTDFANHRALQDLPTDWTQNSVRVRQTEEILVPVTVGWLRPTILLPSPWGQWSDEKLRAVIVHELTHVERRDFFVAVATELNRCLYWFHPISWWLRRQLADLAEEACDDAAIEQTGDPTGYARHLLELASLLTAGKGRRIQPGLSMARESNVESRIQTILNFQRPLSKRIGWPAAVAIVVGFAVAITSAAALRPVAAAPVVDADSDSNDVVADEKESDHIRIHGRVVDSEDRPIPGARVRLYRTLRPEWYAATPVATLIEELKVDEEGRFDRMIDRSLMSDLTYRDRRTLVVSADGYALAAYQANPSIPVIDGKPVHRPDILKHAIEARMIRDVPMKGRVLSIEGLPVPNATVSVVQLERSTKQKLNDWIERAREKPLVPDNSKRLMMMGGPPQSSVFPTENRLHLPVAASDPVQTDAGGTFEIKGVGPDDVVVLRVKGEGITNTMIHVLGRDMDAIFARHVINTSKAGAYYGREFDFIAQPSLPVFGIVRDIETKEPVVDVPVAIGGVYGASMSHTGYVVTRTDAEGRYRIEGLPIPPKGTRKWDRNGLSVRPTGLPYIENDRIPIPRGDGINPVEFNVELRRAVIAKGRLTDKATGNPIKAKLYYTPFSSNDHCKDFLRYADDLTTMLGNDTRYTSDEDGYFEIPVIPGRGVIAAKAYDAGEFIAGYGKADIEEFRDSKGGLSRNTSDHVVVPQYHCLKEVDVPADVKEVEVAMHVDRGETMLVRFVDPDGNALNDVGGSGHDSSRTYKPYEGDHVKVVGLTYGEIRPMTFSQNVKGLGRLYRLIPEKGKSEVTVTLFPESKLIGRLVDPEGQPLSEIALEPRHDNTPNSIGVLQTASTDDDGRFECSLRSGATYSILGRTAKFVNIAKDIKVREAVQIDLGDVVVDPDAERWADAKPKRDPVITDLKPKASGD